MRVIKLNQFRFRIAVLPYTDDEVPRHRLAHLYWVPDSISIFELGAGVYFLNGERARNFKSNADDYTCDRVYVTARDCAGQLET